MAERPVRLDSAVPGHNQDNVGYLCEGSEQNATAIGAAGDVQQSQDERRESRRPAQADHTWLAVVVGLGILYSRITVSRGQIWTSSVMWGWMLLGWGAFNVVEGLMNHHFLGIHHVISGDFQTLADILFLVFGALLIAGGWLLQHSGQPMDVAD